MGAAGPVDNLPVVRDLPTKVHDADIDPTTERAAIARRTRACLQGVLVGAIQALRRCTSERPASPAAVWEYIVLSASLLCRLDTRG